MSAFVVQDKTINSVVTWLRDCRDFSFYLDRGNVVLGTLDDCAEFGQKLFDMNCQAIDQRYGSGQAGEFRDLDYKFTYELGDIHSAYKSLRCLLYQCSEGNVPDSDLYKLMDDISSAMAHRIAHNSPQVEAAAWG